MFNVEFCCGFIFPRIHWLFNGELFTYFLPLFIRNIPSLINGFKGLGLWLGNGSDTFILIWVENSPCFYRKIIQFSFFSL